mgnify:CR=1 FL=1
MWAGKKAAGKKNKFEMEKGLVFNKSFDLVLSLKNFNFCNLAGSIAYNGKRIAEVREKGSRNFQLYPNVSKMFFRELNYEKPVKRKTFCG